MNKTEEKLIKTLKPFWQKQEQIIYEAHIKVHDLEVEMNKKIKYKYPLEFFFVEGEIVGIGASNYGDREHFPLIHDTELG